GARLAHPGVIDAHVLASRDFERVVVAAEIDREPAVARRLAADRAVAEVERIGMARAHAKAHRAAVTGTLQPHDASPPQTSGTSRIRRRSPRRRDALEDDPIGDPER